MEDEKKLKDLVKSLFHSYKLGDKFDEIGVVNSWEQIAGGMIAQKTEKVYIRDKVLHLTLSSAPLKNELRYHKLVLIEKVNTFAGREMIKDIHFY